MATLLLASSRFSLLPQLLDAAPTQSRVGFVGTAGDVYDDPFWVADNRSALVSMGFAVQDLALEATGNNTLTTVMPALDVIFVAGGNTYYLMQQMRLSGFDRLLQKLLRGNGVYVGVSAGAIVMGPELDTTAESDQRAFATMLHSTAGMGAVPFAVLPHAGRNEPRFIEHHSRVIEGDHQDPVIRITDDEAIVVDASGIRIEWMP